MRSNCQRMQISASRRISTSPKGRGSDVIVINARGKQVHRHIRCQCTVCTSIPISVPPLCSTDVVPLINSLRSVYRIACMPYESTSHFIPVRVLALHSMLAHQSRRVISVQPLPPTPPLPLSIRPHSYDSWCFSRTRLQLAAAAWGRLWPIAPGVLSPGAHEPTPSCATSFPCQGGQTHCTRSSDQKSCI